MEWVREILYSSSYPINIPELLKIVLLFTALVFSSYVLHSIYSYLKFYYVIRKLPGPKPHPILGNLDKYTPSEEGIINTDKYILEHPNEKVLRFSVGPFLHLVRFSYPEEVGELLCMKPSELPKSKRLYGIVQEYLGEGLLISNNDKWQYRRRLLTPGFHYDVLIPYVSIYNDTVEVFIDNCDRRIEGGLNWIGLFETFTLLTLDNMLKCVCSFESNCQCQQEDDEYVSAIKSNAELARLQVFYLPYQIKPIFYFSPDGARWRKNCKTVQEHALKVIRKRRELLLSNQGAIDGKSYKDFIDILLTARDGEGNGLTNEDIVEEMTTFIFRGHDTTASGISWTLYLLAKNPEYQEMCRKEIKGILCGRNSNRIEFEDIPKLKYLTMCIKESLRMHSPVNDVFRTTVKDMHFGGHLIPKGTTLIIAIGGLHRNPHVWKDPYVFNPSRFDCDLPGGHPFAFIPFSAGHRNCIGQKFALNEEVVTIARIINHYNLEPVTKKVRRMPVVVLKPEGDIRIKLSKIVD